MIKILFTFASLVFAPISFGSDKTNSSLLIGTSSTTCMTLPEAERGRSAKLKFKSNSPNYPISLNIQGGQSNLNTEVVFRSGTTARINLEFDIGYDNYGIEKPTNKYCIGQFDFDKDGLPELVIAVEDSNFNGMTGVSVNIFKYYPPAREQDTFRSQNWILIGKFTAPNVAGVGKVIVNGISITIPRNFRNFFYELSWVKGKFVETSDY